MADHLIWIKFFARNILLVEFYLWNWGEEEGKSALDNLEKVDPFITKSRCDNCKIKSIQDFLKV